MHDEDLAEVAVIGAAAGAHAGHALARLGQQILQPAVLARLGLAAAGDGELVGLAGGDGAVDFFQQQAFDDAARLDQREQLGLARRPAALGRHDAQARDQAVQRDADLHRGIHALRDLDGCHRLGRVVLGDQAADRVRADLQLRVARGLEPPAQPQGVDARKMRVIGDAHAQCARELVERRLQFRAFGGLLVHVSSAIRSAGAAGAAGGL